MAANSKLVNRTRFSNSLRNDLIAQFEALHKETDIPKSKLLDQAVELLLEKQKSLSKNNRDIL
ncbi:ribbon-helix-helix domain-containing protein [Bacillus infantis]|uniref:Ribbon-helix-helix domain-containing protein n=2 Tax=Bacillus infantis TaxID=324767 RepID=A0A5D4SDH2_9BACI|nr:ribbon-helix-helix domain-containing protein [Bacillus infantis]TYS60711.1 ribbon-helix-helix domain-containing protein [Bacillus infantis]